VAGLALVFAVKLMRTPMKKSAAFLKLEAATA
jgi:hypothetical protein